jgi:alpha-beta hydrolase superfamily lysophospholipase
MRNLIIALSLLLSACAEKIEVPPLKFDTSYTIQKPAVSNGKRAYLIHGSISYDRSQWEHPAFRPFIDGLLNQGYEVVTFDRPDLRREYFIDGGAEYRQGFEAQLRAIYADAELNHGHMNSITGGFSLGGLHSMMAAVDCADLFPAYFAILPVVRLDALSELKGLNFEHFNPELLVSDLQNVNGLISWGTRDYRVDWTLSRTLSSQLPHVTAIEYNGLDHTTSPLVVADTLIWIHGL